MRRDSSDTTFVLSPAEEGSDFTTLRRQRTLASFNHVTPDGETRVIRIEKLMTMSVTRELAERFGGVGYVQSGKRYLQMMIDQNIPPIVPVDTLYYLRADDETSETS